MPPAPESHTRADKRLHQPALDAPASSRGCRCSTATLSTPAGDIVVLRVAGEVDVATFPELDAALDDVLDQRPDHLIFDLTGLIFCSSRGFTAITRTAQAAAAHGMRFSTSGASPLLARLWPHYWPDGDAPRIHRTTAAAVLFAITLQADVWNPQPDTHSVPTPPIVDVQGPDSPPTRPGEDLDDTASPDGGHQPRPDPHHTDPARLRQALHRHRTGIYRSALYALGAPPLAPDLDAQLRIALAGFAAAPPPNNQTVSSPDAS